MALACAMRTPADPQFEIKDTSLISRGSPQGSFTANGRGKISAPAGETRLGPLAAATQTRPGLGGHWIMTGNFLPLSICSYATEARSR